ncbi:MAG: HAD family phosphatase [Clostridia bacterium]|nr:HAD family hydrolase [Lachnospiraceae bacterium]NCC00008.1 HAD family phosphatase [Clostridia bacterium]NCD03550.1 HAD family phosphatase [Clostridia bacterium]
MIKLVVSDVDGTLVPEGCNQINPEVFNTIRKLRSQGIFFAVASGRHKCSVEKLFAPVKEDIIYITSNGAYTGTYNKPLFTAPLPKEAYQKLFTDFNEMKDFPYLAETIERAYTNSTESEFIHLLKDDYNYDLDYKEDMMDFSDEIIKLSLYHPVNAKDMDPKIMKSWNKVSKCSVSGTHWIDFMAPDINKGVALSRLQETLGITIHETLAFGDQSNDIEMLKQAYFSFAMANAVCLVKNAARFTCDSCEQDGVLKTIHRFMEQK